ncbi:hypothetical protein [Comamonas aquatica]|uniref:hypothetical protein n=1 Tax=Comamonas aquatica TaxID=225991 RepID=UPI0028D53F59|nr:hypothetical protein [Comamonas aquatica]
MATDQERQQLINQIPTEQGRAAPAAKRLGSLSTSEVGRNLTNTAMALPAVGGAVRAAAAAPAVSRLVGGSIAGAGSVAGAAKAAAPYITPGAGLAAVSAASEAERPATAQRLATYQPQGAPPQQPAAASPAPAQTAAAAIPNAQAGQIEFDAASNTYSGKDVGAGAQILNGRGGGAVSAQNQQAADRLAQMQQFESVARVAGSDNVPQSPQRGRLAVPTATHSGNDWRARETLRRLKMDADSLIHKDPRARRQAQAAYQQAATADVAAMTGGQTNIDAKAMELDAGLQREGMQQQGANQRAAIGERTAAQRLAMDGRRLNLEETTQGFQNRQAQRVEQAQAAYLTAETDEARNVAQKRLATLTGRADAADWGVQVTPTTKNVDGSTTQGSVIRYNKRTGEVQEVGSGTKAPAAPANAAERVVGQLYTAPNGQPVRWTKEGWQAS